MVNSLMEDLSSIVPKRVFGTYAGSDGQDQTAHAQSDQRLYCPRIDSLDSIYRTDGISIVHYENTPIPNIQKISPPKTENFQTKTMIFFMFLLKT